MTKLLLSICAVLMIWALPARAGEVTSADAQEFQRIISAQISAFNADDGETAYGFASPMIRQMFQTSDNFMGMVKKGYPPVYRQKSYVFGEVAEKVAGLPTQEVTIIDVTGRIWVAIYTMQLQPDGTWKINGCSLIEAPGADA